MQLSINIALPCCNSSNVAVAVTSAAVDAYCARIPVVSMVNSNTLNLSPLRCFPGVYFAETPSELAECLGRAINPMYPSPTLDQGFFALDGKLTRWKRLLSELAES